MAKTPTPTNPADQHNIIGKDTVIEGTLRSSGNVHISGTVNGNVDVQGRTIVMPGGRVDGEVSSTSAEIGGRIQGQVNVKERLVLKSTAVVDGDIRTDKLVIEDGAAFSGRCDMGGGAASNRPARPDSSSASSGSKPGGGKPDTSGADRPTRQLGGTPDASRGAASS